MGQLTYSKLGTMGRLGNQLFELASLIGLATKYNREWSTPFWKYSQYFEGSFPMMKRSRNQVDIPERHYHYTPKYWDEKILANPTKDIDISGWLQSEKYFLDIKERIKKQFTFRQDTIDRLRKRFKEVFEKPVIAISVRRGDFVKNSNYEQLPAFYYVGALVKYFPNYKDYNILFLSDDLSYCRHHFQCLPNAFYANSAVDIEQLLLMTECQHFIVSNSTFSWWGAWLGQKEGSIVVRPNYNLAGDLKKNNNEKDYWPENWTTVYDHKVDKIDLSDVTFTIPVHYDHEDRMQNFKASTDHLDKAYKTNIIVGEQGGNHFAKCGFRYTNFPYKQFHRTKMLNEMAEMSKTPIIANWDADVFVPPMQIWETVRAIREGEDMVYPYDGRFSRMERKKWYNDIRDLLDTGVTSQVTLVGARPQDGGSVGGAVFFNKESFIGGGLENENFISYAPEDQERYHRFSRLGYSVKRIQGQLFHMDHHVGNNSHCQHTLYPKNEEEFHRILNIKDLRLEIQKWPWFNQYSKKYYEEIMQGSTKSRDEIFKLPLVTMGVQSIIDVGSGVGQWGKDLDKYKYIGIDYKIPRRHLLIPEENYYEYDLTSSLDFPVQGKFDLVLCLEVLEHIPIEYAEKSIDLLTSLGDKVLFSAAIPGQGGNNHVNCKFQSYWAALFKQRGFEPLSLDIRNNDNIEIWYRNNAVLYIKGTTGQTVQDYVHPKMFCNIVGSLTHWKEIRPYEEYRNMEVNPSN